MRFLVPQFIEVEDKIVGPLSFKQAAYLLGAGGVAVILITRLGFFWAMMLGMPFYVIAAALAFMQINDRPFSHFLYAALFYSMRKKLYIWKKQEKRIAPTQLPEAVSTPSTLPFTLPTSQSRLKELAWTLDTQGSMYETEDSWK